MATTADLTLDEEASEVQIHNLVVRDPEVVSYLAEFDEPDRTDALDRALRVGVETLDLAETAKDLEHVRREFDDLQQAFEAEIEDVRSELEDRFGEGGDVEETLDEHFGDDGALAEHFEEVFGEEGKLTERLDEELGEDGERIQAALDPDTDGTPTNRLRRSIKEEIDALRKDLVEEEVREEERAQSYKKGGDFEDALADLLQDYVYQSPDTYTYTGDTEGELPGRDVGDFVLTLGETDQRIVIEAKSQQGQTKPSIREEMSDAIENRDADYGVFVVESEAYVTDEIGYFAELDDDVLVVSLSGPTDDDIDPGFLRIALGWARTAAVQQSLDAGEGIDPQTIDDRVESARDTLDRISNIKRRCTDIEDTAQDIKGDLDELRDDVQADLDDITTELSKESSS